MSNDFSNGEFSGNMSGYRDKGFAKRSGYGNKACLLVVDFIVGFTDPSTPLGGDFSSQLAVTNRLLPAFRSAGLPVAYTTIAYESHFRDAGMFIKKVPSLAILLKGTPMVEVDSRIAPKPGDRIVEKKYASAFFGTDLDSWLRSQGVDTIVMVGCTTSGCIRASAIDSLQHGYHTVVVRDGVGDRPEGTHEANLVDIDAKYGDVVSAAEVLEHLKSKTAAGGLAAQANADFMGWWNHGR